MDKFDADIRAARGDVKKKGKEVVASESYHDLPDKSGINDALLDLQIKSNGSWFIHFSTPNEETAWLMSFTNQISMIPEWK